MKRLFALMLAAAMTLTMTACGGDGGTSSGGSGSSGGGETKDTLVIGHYGDTPNFDTHNNLNDNGMRINMIIYDPLVRMDSETYEIQPCIAKSWTVSDDGTEYTFAIKSGVKFSDGTDMTVDDVVFSLQRGMEMPMAVPSFARVTGVELALAIMNVFLDTAFEGGRHQRRVGEQPGVHVVGVFGALVLELGHAGKFAELGVAGQHPGQLGMGGHMALHKQHMLLRVNADGQQQGGQFPGVAAQRGGVLPHGQGVQVGHHVQAVVAVLQKGPVAQRPQVVAQRRGAGGLNAGQDPLAGRQGGGGHLLFRHLQNAPFVMVVGCCAVFRRGLRRGAGA